MHIVRYSCMLQNSQVFIPYMKELLINRNDYKLMSYVQQCLDIIFSLTSPDFDWLFENV